MFRGKRALAAAAALALFGAGLNSFPANASGILFFSNQAYANDIVAENAEIEFSVNEYGFSSDESPEIAYSLSDPSGVLEWSEGNSRIMFAEGFVASSAATGDEVFREDYGLVFDQGVLTEDLVIRTEDSPVLLKSSVQIPFGVTVTVEPGVKIYVGDIDQAFWVRGDLDLSGTESAPVEIFASKANVFEYAGAESASITARHTKFLGGQNRLFTGWGGLDVNISDSEIVGFQYGVSPPWDGTVSITGSVFKDTGRILLTGRESLIFSDNLVILPERDADDWLVRYDNSNAQNATIANNSFINPYEGFFVIETDVDMSGNYFPGIGFSGIGEVFLDATDSFSYDGTVTVSSILAEPSANAPISSSIVELTDSEKLSFSQFRDHIRLVPKDSLSSPASVQLVAFVDSDSNGQLDSGEYSREQTFTFYPLDSLSSSIERFDHYFTESNINFSGYWRLTPVSGDADEIVDLSNSQLERYRFELYRDDSKLPVVVSARSTAGESYQGSAYLTASTSSISPGSYELRVYQPSGTLLASDQIAIADTSDPVLSWVHNPSSVAPGAVGEFQYLLTDGEGNPIETGENSPNLSLEWDGPGLVLTDNLGTEANGRGFIYAIMGANDSGSVSFTIRYSAEGEVLAELSHQFVVGDYSEDVEDFADVRVDVVDSSGEPIVGAEVYISIDDRYGSTLASASSSSFLFDSMPIGDARVEVRPYGNESVPDFYTSVDYFSHGPQGSVIEVVARPYEVGDKSVSGRILDHNGNPLQGTLKLKTSPFQRLLGPNNRTYEQTTDETGQYVFENLPQDYYFLEVREDSLESEIDYLYRSSSDTFLLSADVNKNYVFAGPSGTNLEGQTKNAVTGEPMPAVSVSYSLEDSVHTFSGDTVSDSEGNFVIENVPTSAIDGRLLITTEDFSEDADYYSDFWVYLDLQTEYEFLELELSPVELGPGTVSGTVSFSDTGLPVQEQDVNVSFFANGEWVGLTDATDADGNYSVSGLYQSAPIRVSVSSPDYISYESYNFGFTLYPPNQSRELDIVLQAKAQAVANASISGFVRDNLGDPVAGAYLMSEPPGLSMAEAVTAADGSFTLTGLSSGETFVNVYASGSADKPEYVQNNGMDALKRTLVLSAGENQIDFQLTKAVYGENTALGQILDSAGDPIAGAQVSAFATDEARGSTSAFSDASGRFQLKELARGKYRISIQPNTPEVVPLEPFFIEIRDGFEYQMGQIQFNRVSLNTEAVTVTAREKQTLLPLASRTISLSHLDLNRTYSATTDEFGMAEFEALPLGSYRPRVQRGLSFTDYRELPILEITETSKSFSLSVSPYVTTGSMSGVVEDSFGNPIADARLLCYDNIMFNPGDGESKQFSAYTGADGSYFIPNIVLGRELECYVDPNQGSLNTPLSSREFSAVITPNSPDVTRDFVLYEGASIAGRLADESGNPASNVRVVAIENSGDSIDTLTDGSGSFIIENISPGDYQLYSMGGDFGQQNSVFSAGYIDLVAPQVGYIRADPTLAETISLTEGASRNLGEIITPESSSIAGSVDVSVDGEVKPVGRRFIEVEVYVETEQGYQLFEPATETAFGWKDPNYVIDGLPPGTYKLAFVDYRPDALPMDTVYSGNESSLELAQEIQILEGENVLIPNITMQVVPPTAEPSLNIGQISQQTLEASKLAITENSERLFVGTEYALDYVGFVNEVNALQTMNFESDWQLVSEDGTLETPETNTDKYLVNTTGDFVGWIEATSSPEEGEPGSGGSTGAPAAGGGGGGGGAAGSAPIVETPPTIAGSNNVGSTLGAGIGEWDSEEYEFSYQWYRCDDQLESPTQLQVLIDCDLIQGATNETYVVTEADSDKHLLASISASAGFYSTTAFSNTIAPGETIEGDFSSEESVETPSAAATETGFWTKRNGDNVKIYAKNIIGLGKVQFFVNGEEIAWIRAEDLDDPKLRVITEGPMTGASYLVRDKDLRPGKNVFEIYVDGERVERRVASLN